MRLLYIHFELELRRSPLGLRGLKYNERFYFGPNIRSQPTRAAWIEIESFLFTKSNTEVAAHSGCVD